jgi:hypothetical protein
VCKYVDEINYLNAMSLIFIHTDLVDPWVLSSLVDDMTKEIQSLETEEKIKTNMIGNEGWSLKSMIGRSEFDLPKGRLQVSYDGKVLTSISCMYRTEGVVSENEYRIAARLWIHPAYRNRLYPSVYHVLPALQFAALQKAQHVWTSFNQDREALLRRMNILSSTSGELSLIWSDWKAKKAFLYGEIQLITYKDLSALETGIAISTLYQTHK